ncbi:MAG: GNAT family N-acetyltransferase [Bacteroidales bacterium]|nr:GNAT family N-acetyltransferase [Bacteroidales bacterium]
MKKIIDPIPVNQILEELTPERFVRQTNNGKNEIYVLNAFNAPNVLREIGRLREISFRDSGGGTGLDCDLDIFDTNPDNYFEQLIVWNPYDKAIVGGYRYMLCDKLKSTDDGHVDTPTGELFRYSEKFVHEYLPYTIELGRSFVQPDYQPSKSLSKGMYSLDNLWDGLGSLCKTIPQAKYFFGKVTMYPQLERVSRDLILYFMKTNFPDPDHLLEPWPELALPIVTDESQLKAIFKGKDYTENYRILVKNVRERGAAVPPLVNAYMNLSSTMRSFGTALNAPFGNVEETGILVTINDIFSNKYERYTNFNPDEKPLHYN